MQSFHQSDTAGGLSTATPPHFPALKTNKMFILTNQNKFYKNNLYINTLTLGQSGSISCQAPRSTRLFLCSFVSLDHWLPRRRGPLASFYVPLFPWTIGFPGAEVHSHLSMFLCFLGPLASQAPRSTRLFLCSFVSLDHWLPRHRGPLASFYVPLSPWTIGFPGAEVHSPLSMFLCLLGPLASQVPRSTRLFLCSFVSLDHWLPRRRGPLASFYVPLSPWTIGFPGAEVHSPLSMFLCLLGPLASQAPRSTHLFLCSFVSLDHWLQIY